MRAGEVGFATAGGGGGGASIERGSATGAQLTGPLMSQQLKAPKMSLGRVVVNSFAEALSRARAGSERRVC